MYLFQQWAERVLNAVPTKSRPGVAEYLCPYHDDSDPSAIIDLETGSMRCRNPNCILHTPMWADQYTKDRGGEWPPEKPNPDGTTYERKPREERPAVAPPKPRVESKSKRCTVPGPAYIYRTADGKPHVKVQRFLDPDSSDKDFRQKHYRPGYSGKWANGGDRKADKYGWVTGRTTEEFGTVPHVLYNLPEVVKAETVLFVEGEKDVETARTLGLVATSSAEGAGKGKVDLTEDWTPLHGKRIVFAPDNDDIGRSHVKDVYLKIRDGLEAFCVLELPDAKPKGDLSDWVAAGGTIEELEALIQEAWDSPLPEWMREAVDGPAEEEMVSGGVADGMAGVLGDRVEASLDRPEVKVNNRDPLELLDEVVEILLRSGNTYSYQGMVACVNWSPGEKAQIETLEYRQIGTFLIKRMRFQEVKKDKHGDLYAKPVDPPKDLRMNVANEAHKRLPVLLRVIDLPTYTQDGRLLCQPGYDIDTGIFYGPRIKGKIEPPQKPTKDQVKKSIEFLTDNVLGDFPFADETSSCHALCALLQPFIQDYIDGPTPAYLYSAPVEGTGKSMLADATALICSHKPARINCKEEEELYKQVNTRMMSGPRVMILDNVKSKLDYEWLQSILTSKEYDYRPLGTNKSVEISNRATWMISMNTPRLNSETARRTIPVRLDAKVEAPNRRQGFKHKSLLVWVEKNRAALCSAALTILQGWFDAGAPEDPEARLGSFESWVPKMGGLCKWMGILGFLGDQGREMEEQDEMLEEWRTILQAISEIPSVDGKLLSGRIYEWLEQDYLLPREVAMAPLQQKHKQLGYYLVKNSRRPAGNLSLCIEKSTGKRRVGNLYSVVKIEGQADGGSISGATLRSKFKFVGDMPEGAPRNGRQDGEILVKGGPESGFLGTCPQLVPNLPRLIPSRFSGLGDKCVSTPDPDIKIYNIPSNALIHGGGGQGSLPTCPLVPDSSSEQSFDFSDPKWVAEAERLEKSEKAMAMMKMPFNLPTAKAKLLVAWKNFKSSAKPEAKVQDTPPLNPKHKPPLEDDDFDPGLLPL